MGEWVGRTRGVEIRNEEREAVGYRAEKEKRYQ